VPAQEPEAEIRRIMVLEVSCKKRIGGVLKV
jgi:hypothetical protein